MLVEPADLLSEVWGFFKPQEDAEPRTRPVAMSSPRRIEITTRVHAPPGFSVVDVPKSLDEQAGPARWTRSSHEEDGVFVLENAFEVDGPRSFPAEQLEPVRALVGRVQASPTLMITLEHEGRPLLRSGHFSEVLAAARADAAEHPDDPLPRLRQAEALLAAGRAGRAGAPRVAPCLERPR